MTAERSRSPEPPSSPPNAKRSRIDSESALDGDLAHDGAVDDFAVKVSSGPQSCPYLDTINRRVLDFDFEKLCSISLSTHNVYGCLVCGKYYQGRGRNSHAYIHALHDNHHVFINLTTSNIYCLPDGYEVHDASLDDIKYNLFPKLDPQQLAVLDSNPKFSQALDGVDYLPGIIGLNDIKSTDWFNATMQSLMRIRPLRDFFAVPENYKDCQSRLVIRFGELVRKFWNPKLYRAHVSPHELLQEVATQSKKQFRIGYSSDPIQFLAWFLNELHRGLTHHVINGIKQPSKKSSIVTDVFQGKVEITSMNLGGRPAAVSDIPKSAKVVPFLYLSLDLPESPLFKDTDSDREIIPQVPLFVLLQKFDGVTYQNFPNGESRLHNIQSLPPYLILHIKRFTKNNFFIEKNNTIVNFPINNLDLKDYCASAHDEKNKETLSTRYNLIASICHEGELTTTGNTIGGNLNTKESGGRYRAHVWSRSNRQWYDIQDLHVQETMPQLVALSESYIQVWERI